ncbi:MAG TPA: prephenate dehydrogenase [Actinocrinis sp.]|jgi:prephenate dehydrogenase|uniref:prephenate dehydrogenase n=1 Tax=Actinocrinis sp. TaxID=1920516 RepID=UPI002DDCCA6A|nr:prephenate dehydrogenase [Actinocrinis sp.]HEV3168991.1 prephenate dehydrogenase [Actinocrinis sp.]
MRTAAIIGTGLIGTSAALALNRRGVRVYLADRDEDTLRTAASLGAGEVGAPPERVDLAIVAVPPAYVADVLVEAQGRGLARTYTDVASVKADPQHAAAARGVDPETYIGGHPLAGVERSGPLAARADLFDGRPWVLTPASATGREALNRALELISLCGAVPVVMDAAEHDHAVALISHTPHVVAALMAARLEHAHEDAARIAGPGVRDVTRVAGGDPRLWEEILTANSTAVADVLEDYAADLAKVVAALRALGAQDLEKRGTGRADLVDLLRRGNAGQSRIPGKHGAPRANYVAVAVVLSDAPGELARLFAAAGAAGVNIEDVRIEHSPGQAVGLVTLQVAPDSADTLAQRLTERGWDVQR